MKAAGRQKVRRLQTDRFDGLPKELLLCILSFLTIEEAARTSLLSKRWLHLWKYAHVSFDLDARKIFGPKRKDMVRNLDKRTRYINWVNKVIKLHKGPTISDFRIFFQLNATSAHHIDKWIEFAFEKRVQRLELDFNFFKISASPYVFPEHICSYFKASRPGFGIASQLTSLCFNAINISGEQLECLLSVCPFLEELRVTTSDHLVKFRVSGSSLRLRLLQICYCLKLQSIEISAPQLVSLEYIGYRTDTRLLIENTPMLTDANIRVGTLTEAFDMLSSYLSQLETLTLDLSFVMRDDELMPSVEFADLKNLTLKVVSRYHYHHGHGHGHGERLLGWIQFLMKASPSLQKFRLELELTDKWVGKLEEAECPHQRLKVVEFVGFRGRAIEKEVLDIFVENANALEKIDIYFDYARILNQPWRYEKSKTKKAKKNALQFKKTLPPCIKLNIF